MSSRHGKLAKFALLALLATTAFGQEEELAPGVTEKTTDVFDPESG
jgi:hypothetical protein